MFNCGHHIRFDNPTLNYISFLLENSEFYFPAVWETIRFGSFNLFSWIFEFVFPPKQNYFRFVVFYSMKLCTLLWTHCHITILFLLLLLWLFQRNCLMLFIQKWGTEQTPVYEYSRYISGIRDRDGIVVVFFFETGRN